MDRSLVSVGWGAGVRIGANVDIGPRVAIVAGSHELYAGSERAAGPGYSSPVTIQDGVWLGAASTILGDVVVGHGSMVAGGAIVTGNVSARTVVGGVPIRALRSKLKEFRE